MVCSSCGTAAIPGSKFCARCGARLTRACPACGFAIDPADTFCRECGAPLTSASGGSSAGTTAPAGPLLNPTPLSGTAA
ncbi:MAG: zinc-ribbon domain-containing protein, partial [Candidatus Dormiibacterota bacterium]